MWSTDVLREEHRWILLLLGCLERALERSQERGRMEGDTCAEILALLRHFADGLHQEREERFLFPLLLRRARDVDERLEVARLSGEHEEERRALARLDRSLLGAVYGQPESVRDFQRDARRALELQREHVARENRVLLPLAERLLTPADDQALVRAFAALESSRPDLPRLVLIRIEALCARLEVVAPA